MKALIKLVGFLILGTLLNILYTIIFHPDSSNGATAIQLLLFIVAWIIVEGIYQIGNSKRDANLVIPEVEEEQ